ncbi:ubiquitin-like protein Pup [Propionibacteriaceae bacterium Y2011]|uniref:ubiquitin-like protein Pup n=1 Tax=Microlunatus sp. Y2014 TaxID=3418488 RepID=UPI003B488046
MSEQSQPNRRPDEPEPEPAPLPQSGGGQRRDEDIDSLLDDIDDVLEVNAEEFVRSFVQKGGQ